MKLLGTQVPNYSRKAQLICQIRNNAFLVITRGLLVPNQYFFVPNSAKFVPLYGLRAVPLFQKRNSWFVPNSIIGTKEQK